MTFNRTKSGVQAFVRDTLRKRHPLYHDVTDVPRLREHQRFVRRAQTPRALATLLAKLPTSIRTIALSMAVTGMGPKEYWGRWATSDDPMHVHIDGTKRKARVRDVPRWAPDLPHPPSRSRHWFRMVWAKKLGGELAIYDLRRSFAVWMEDAGIPRSRRRMYLGHSVRDVTDLYERRELRAWLAEDAELLRRYAGEAIQDALDAPEPTTEAIRPRRQPVDRQADAELLLPQA